MMAELFTGGPMDPDDLESVIYQAVGCGSTCWEDLDSTGVFQSDRAKAVADEAIGWIRQHYTKNT
jgi:hypothetical protein